MVLHPTVQQVLPGEDVGEVDDGQGSSGTHAGGSELIIVLVSDILHYIQHLLFMILL